MRKVRYSRRWNVQGSVPVQVGKEYEGKIIGMSRGDGVAKIRGFVIFVPSTRSGEHVRFRITRVAPRYATAVRLHHYRGRWGIRWEVERRRREDFQRKRWEDAKKEKRKESYRTLLLTHEELGRKGIFEDKESVMDLKNIKPWWEETEWWKNIEKEKMTEQEFEREQLAKGLVKYKGQWITPEQKSKLEEGLLKYGERWGAAEEVERWKREDFEKAQIAKGLVKYEDEWITKEELFEREQISKGLVKYKGKWTKPNDVKEVKKLLKLLEKEDVKAIKWLHAHERILWDIIKKNLCCGYKGYIVSLISFDFLQTSVNKLLKTPRISDVQQKRILERYLKSLKNLMKSYGTNIGPLPSINEGKLQKMYNRLPNWFLSSLFEEQKLPAYKSVEDLPATLELAGMDFYTVVDQIRARARELDCKFLGFVPLDPLKRITKKSTLQIDNILSKADFPRLKLCTNKRVTDLALVAYRLDLCRLVEIWLRPKIENFEKLRKKKRELIKRRQIEEMRVRRETFRRY